MTIETSNSSEKNQATQAAISDIQQSGYLIASGEPWAAAVWKACRKHNVDQRHRAVIIESLLSQERASGTVDDSVTAASLTVAVLKAGAASLDTRRKIILGDQIHREVRPVIEAVGAVTDPDREVFQRDGRLVEIVGTSIRDLPRVQIKMRINAAINCLKPSRKGERSIEPPNWLVESVESAARYGDAVRTLDGVIVTPTIRPDGSVLQVAGYDPATRLYYRPSAAFPIVPESPTRDDAVAAGERLLAVLADSPFATPSDRSSWLSMLLTIIGRSSVDGQTPLFAITANTSGSGKTIAAKVLSQIAFGTSARCTPYPSSESELRKVITTMVAVNSETLVLFDNIDRPVGGASLDGVLTADAWTDRELGRSRSISTSSIRTVFALTGNNVRFNGDTGRRVLPIRLRSDRERPADRTDWRHEDIVGWARDHRASLVVDALTMLRAFAVAGSPAQPGGEWGGYGSWSRVIRSAIVWAGLADPIAGRHSVAASDNSRSINQGLIIGLREIAERIDMDRRGMTTREIVDSLDAMAGHDCPTLRDVLAELPERGDKITPRLLGGLLARYRDNLIGGERIVSLGKAAGGYARWGVESSASEIVSQSSE